MTAAIAPLRPALKRTPLYDLHVAMGARMAPFAGYDMPIQYPAGVMKEHLHTRAAASLFDVSHMGQIVLRPNGGTPADIALALERLVPVDVLGLAPGRQRYAFFTNALGGIIDDLMITACAGHFVLVVNASRKDVDETHLRAAMSRVCTIEVLADRALLALQGPKAEEVLVRLAPEAAAMRFMDARMLAIGGAACLVTRSGYTGEDGFEISVAGSEAERLARMLLNDASVALAGLGARDSLRTEAGLCLYGADLDEQTTPVEAALEWAVQKVRRPGGARAGGFPGADAIAHELQAGPKRRRVGLRSLDRTPVRGGALLFAEHSATEPVGTVTSGGFGPSAGGPVAMGYVSRPLAVRGTSLFAAVRGNRVPVEVTDLPFVPHRYKRANSGANPSC
jgi:glycine cleavage system T protein (aminomethyltransferase)